MKRTYCGDCLQLVAERAASCPHCGADRPAPGWPEDPLIGAAVGGKYRVLRQLERGAIGVVYLAVHVELEAYRALKVLEPRLAHDERIRRRFEREAKALYRLDPRHIVRLEDFGEVRPNLPFMALEYVEGQSLAELLRAEGPLSVRRALRLARQVAVALVDAATEGVVHRDLRPENVLVRYHATRGDEVKVREFGVAKILGEHTLTKTGGTTRTGLLSRPEYVAPELFTGAQAADARADLFSLGVMLYELLSGQTPWASDDREPLAVLARMRDVAPRPLLELRPDLPDGVAELVERLLARSPDDRPSAAFDVVAELDRVGQLGTSVFDAVASGERDALDAGWDDASGALDDTVKTGLPELVRDAERDGPMGPAAREAPTDAGLTGRGAAVEAADALAVRRWGEVRSGDQHTPPSRLGTAPTATAEVIVEPTPSRPAPRVARTAQPTPVRPRERGLLLGAIVLLVVAVAMLAYALFGTLPPPPGAAEGTGAGASGTGSAPTARPSTPLASPPVAPGPGLDMVRLAPGSARVGSSTDELAAQRDLFDGRAATWPFGAVRDVVVDPFFLDRTEVAVADFVAWHDGLDEGTAPCGDAAWRTLAEHDPLAPARGVSFAEAEAYCAARGARLPGFDEWEVAARGPDGGVFPWRGDLSTRGAYNAGSAEQSLWGLAAAPEDGYVGPAPVTALGANGFGLRGLGGNVAEWVTGPGGRADAPPYFHRGGSYLGHPVFTLAYAYQFLADRCVGYPTVGFRCAGD